MLNLRKEIEVACAATVMILKRGDQSKQNEHRAYWLAQDMSRQTRLLRSNVDCGVGGWDRVSFLVRVKKEICRSILYARKSLEASQ